MAAGALAALGWDATYVWAAVNKYIDLTNASVPPSSYTGLPLTWYKTPSMYAADNNLPKVAALDRSIHQAMNTLVCVC